MSEYEIGKDLKELQLELNNLRAILDQLYTIIAHNVKEGTISEPKPEGRSSKNG